MHSSATRWLGIVSGVFGVLAAGLFVYMSGQQQELRSTQSRTQECLDFSGQIHRLRKRAARPTTSVDSSDALGTAIEPLLQEFQLTTTYRGLNQTNVDRADNPDYEQQSYQLRFDAVELLSLVQFCHALTNRRPGLRIAELTLTSAQTAGGRNFQRKETWNVVIVLTQLVFSPKTPS